MERYYQKYIKEDFSKKIILISGPRQSGKTTLSKSISKEYEYLNWDNNEERIQILKKAWNKEKEVVLFDELHKMPKWKAWLKGIYDSGDRQKIIVTGSARLNTMRKVGDSLAGRFFQYRLHPFDIKEVMQARYLSDAEEIKERLLLTGGFPEPFLHGTKNYYNRWRTTHLDIILRQDLLDLEAVKNITGIETLVELLSERVMSPVSYSSLAEDLKVSDKTVKYWVDLLEELYVVFRVYPYSKNIARARTKAPKIYFYDCARVKDYAGRIENLVACALLKEIEFRADCIGEAVNLYYVRDTNKNEIDFLVKKENEDLLIEVKTSDDTPSRSFKVMGRYFSNSKCIQLVSNLTREKEYESGVKIRILSKWLSKMEW